MGYSGNEKYRETLEHVANEAARNKNKRYAERALRDLKRYVPMMKLIAESDFQVEGKSAKVYAYMKMLSTNSLLAQKLAARAIYYEQQGDRDLLGMAVDKLRVMYMKAGLDNKSLDTAAWLIKAIGEGGGKQHVKFLSEVFDETFYPVLKRKAEKYVR